MSSKLHVIAAFLFVFALPTLASARDKAAPTAQETYDEIQGALGIVPSFLREFPAEAIAGAWAEYTGTELNPRSAIPGKYKELIGLAVAAQIPCRYCIYFHTQAARLYGATDKEIKEAVAMAGLTRQWSTVLNGLQIDDAQFRDEVGRVFAYVKKPHAKGKDVLVSDAASAYADMAATLGLVPTFFKKFPEAGIAGAWREYKAIELNPASALPGKYKELIGLAVAAQIPCRYCTYFHTEAARLNSATDAELGEAVAMASITRHWSTWLNGMQIDEQSFRNEVDQIMTFVGKKAAKAQR